MDFLSNLVQQALTFMYGVTETLGMPSYGIAIILMTVIIKIALYPITKKQIESMKAMNKIQPKLKEIQTKYKYD